MFYHNIDPVLLKIGALEIRYYGLMYAIGFIVGYFLLCYLAKAKKLPLKDDDIIDFLVYLLAGLIIGARIFYVAIYSPGYYATHPLEILMIWHGGLSFHGGLIGVIVAGLIFCKKKHVHFYDLADITVIPFAFGLFLGRVGNFLNSELYGRPTSLPWGVSFKGEKVFRHPSQLYEAAKNLFIFSALFAMQRKKLPRGIIFWSFVLLYSVLRFFIEFVREPEIVIGGLTMGQILNIPMFAASLIMLFVIYMGAK